MQTVATLRQTPIVGGIDRAHCAAMAEAIAEPVTATGASGPYAVIPQGREKDYWELSAPSADFLDMQIDKANMYVSPLIITNGAEDRDGEVTNPDGLIEAAYKINPVVFVQHSHRIDPMIPPVGTAEIPEQRDAKGNIVKPRQYNVERRADGWYSGCRFTQATKMAAQTFRLVDDGVLRGRSIGALNHALAPYKPKLPGVAFHNNQIVPVRTKSVSHEKYELMEWSWVWMPANRDIVTPQRTVTPNRDIVPILKGVLSRGKLDGMSLDPGLALVMKSLNLAEPAMATYRSAKVWPFQSGASVVTKSSEPQGTPFEILFSAKSYTPALAKRFLNSNGDLGLIDTQLDSESRTDGMYLKSRQFNYSGPIEDVQDPQVPGMILRFAKAVSPNAELAAQVAEVEEDDDTVDVEAAQQPASAQAAQVKAATAPEATPEAEAAAAVVTAEDTAEVKPEKPGLKYLKALVKQITETADLAEAAMEEQEPELFDKCKEFNSEMRSLIAKVTEFQAERYGKPEEEMAEEPKTAALEKNVKADVFYGRKIVLPSAFTRGLTTLHELATDAKQKQLTGAMLKGVISSIVPEQKPQQKADPRDELKQQLIKRLKQRLVSQVNAT